MKQGRGGGIYFLNETSTCEPYTESEFQARYRFSPNSLQILADLLQEQLIRQTKQSHAIPVDMQLKIDLRFYATGSFLQEIDDTFGYNKSTVSRVVHAVTKAICCHGADFLCWPTDNERAACHHEWIFIKLDNFHVL